MQIVNNTTLQLGILSGIIGLVVGGFLHQLADRALKEESLLCSPSCCSKCHNRLSFWEKLPLVSYLFSGGKCRHCHAKRPWYHPLVEIITAILFILIVKTFGLKLYGIGMLIFISVLIAVSITDFREKIIPHEITYPAILTGIAFSFFVRHDFWGVFAGIGLSYLFFDFLAFYGLKLYLLLRKPVTTKSKKLVWLSADKEASGKVKQLAVPFFKSFDLSFGYIKKSPKQEESIEEFEVIGGADAVLSALIAAWLGFQKLILALFISLLIGTLMGAFYLLRSLYKQRLLKSAIKPVLLYTFSLSGFAALLLSVIASLTHQSILGIPMLILVPIAAFCGVVLGIIAAGSRVSEPFPFGPALAMGATVAMFVKTAN